MKRELFSFPHFLMLHLITFLHADDSCPAGYYVMQGSGEGNINVTQVENLKSCSELCNIVNVCQSFSYNDQDKNCSLDSFVAPVHKQYENELFCSRLCK